MARFNGNMKGWIKMNNNEKAVELISRYLSKNSTITIAEALVKLNYNYSGWGSLKGFEYTPDEMLIEWLEKELA